MQDHAWNVNNMIFLSNSPKASLQKSLQAGELPGQNAWSQHLPDKDTCGVLLNASFLNFCLGVEATVAALYRRRGDVGVDQLG